MLPRSAWRFRRVLLLVGLVIFVLILYLKHKSNDEAQSALSGRGPILEVIGNYKPRLAILVPFRDRFDELLAFVPYMHKFLRDQDIGPYKIYILNQSHKYRFNRGALANVGFLLAQEQSDYIAIHDVDLIPLNQNLSYAYPNKGPHHLTAPQYHPSYNYDKYFGGILLIKNEHFKLVNGFSNRYFGWGLEDDEFYTRVRSARLPISRPMDLKTGKNDTFLHFHYNRKRDMTRSREQSESLKYRDRQTGLSNSMYTLTSSHSLTFDGQFNCTVFNIELFCDIKQTPWCLPTRTRRPRLPHSIAAQNSTNN